MVIDALTIEENAYSGFSHEINLTYADLASMPGALTGTITLSNFVAAEDIIIRAALVVDTAFSGTGITALTVAAADSVPNTVFAATSIFSVAAPSVFPLTIGYNGAANLILTFTATGANVNLATAGQCRILYSKTSLKKLATY